MTTVNNRCEIYKRKAKGTERTQEIRANQFGLVLES